MFKSDGAGFWHRVLKEEGTSVRAWLNEKDNTFELSVLPSVASHDHHMQKRQAAGVYFEIAAKYGEQVNGTVIQKALVDTCKVAAGASDYVAAHYPEYPLMWSHVCPGWRDTFLQVET